MTALQRSVGNAAVSHAVQRQAHRSGRSARPAPVQCVFGADAPKMYTHVAIDKQDAGVKQLRLSLNENGLRTAQSLDIRLAEGSEKMGHHRHVFMWDAEASTKLGEEWLAGEGWPDGHAELAAMRYDYEELP
ncbi:hypothetical protein [Streptomyces sp. NPDC048565]|uniref:hypothetical protein n=1 Tax=Streptomyces sp. NPDC048565 TaxID=3155266 RepID=UPI003447F87C